MLTRQNTKQAHRPEAFWYPVADCLPCQANKYILKHIKVYSADLQSQCHWGQYTDIRYCPCTLHGLQSKSITARNEILQPTVQSHARSLSKNTWAFRQLTAKGSWKHLSKSIFDLRRPFKKFSLPLKYFPRWSFPQNRREHFTGLLWSIYEFTSFLFKKTHSEFGVWGIEKKAPLRSAVPKSHCTMLKRFLEYLCFLISPSDILSDSFASSGNIWISLSGALKVNALELKEIRSTSCR